MIKDNDIKELNKQFQDNTNISFLVGSMPDKGVLSQLKRIVELPPFKDEQICIMPDVHSSKSSVVGFTSTISSDMIIPNIVGGDIGCGVLAINFKPSKKGVDFVKLDKFIRETIGDARFVGNSDDMPFILEELKCFDVLPNKNTIPLSIGTLGSGNHFIELDYDENNKQWWLVIHSGSRNLGTQVAKIYQELADCGGEENIPYDLKWCVGDTTKDYLHDLELAQLFAKTNRYIMAKNIMKAMKWKEISSIDTMHNYIDFDYDTPIIRKGAVSAKNEEELIIPMNMAYGSLLCVGKGNTEWNYSAPHGAGRLLSRTDAKEQLNISEYKTIMKNTWSSCVGKDTIDEAPGAYKAPEEIIGVLDNVVEIKTKLISKYNYKNSKN